VASVALGTAAGPAFAAEDPPGCTTGGLNLSFAPSTGNSVIHRNDDHLDVAVIVRNDAPGACSFVDTTISVSVPKPDGTAGPPVDIVTGASFPGGMAPTTLPTTVPFDFAFNPGVFKGPLSTAFTGTGRFPGGDSNTAGSLGTTVRISRPHVSLSVTPAPASGPAPLSTTYTYEATNDSPVDPDQPTTTPAVAAPSGDTAILADDTCSPLVFTGGDTTVTTPPLLQVGETWNFTCERLFAAPGTFTNHVSVAGSSTRDGRPWPPSTAQSTVTATGPDVAVAKTHQGDFTAGGKGAYEITVRNAGTDPTSGTITVADQLPAALTATAVGGPGWSCALATLTCTRADALAAGASFPPVHLDVSVAGGQARQVVNGATVSGGGEPAGATGNDATSDPTAIVLPDNTFTVAGKSRNRDGGFTLRLDVPGAGRASADDAGRKDLLKAAPVVATGPGEVRLRLRPAKAAKAKLRRGKAVKAKAIVAFTPEGGAESSRSLKLKLKRPKRHR
jgi:uncharacterized repeat protein (TIGR01451 family)